MNEKKAVYKILEKIKHILLRKSDPRQTLLQKLPRSAVGAEIGVWEGEFSKRITEVASPRVLHLIDPWAFQGEFPERMYGGAIAKRQEDMDKIYQSVIEKFRNNQNVKIHRGLSETILQEFDDGYFDWVYIDGNHYYEYVSKDLELSFMKVKTGGLITGDDYTWGAKEGFPVKQAVQDFVNDKNLGKNLKIIDSQFIIKI